MERLSSIDAEDFVELPYIVIDYNSLCESNGEPRLDQARFLESIWEFFNVVVWRQPRFFGKKYRVFDEIFSEFYDLNNVQILECSVKRIVQYVKFHRTILLSDVDYGKKLNLVGMLGFRLCHEFNAYGLKHNFERMARRV